MTGRYQIAGRADIDITDWDDFVDRSDGAWLWHRYSLQEALSTWPGRRDLSFAVAEASTGRIAAVIPLRISEYRACRAVGWSVLESLGGAAFDNRLAEKARRQIWEIVWPHILALAQRHGASDIDLALAPMTPDLRGESCPRVNPLLHLGFSNVQTQTWVVDLRRSAEKVWASMEGRARTAVRKAEKMGTVVRPAGSPDDVDAYYRLHRETCARTGAAPHPKSYFQAIWKSFLSAGLCRIYLAEYEGRVVAAANIGIYKKAGVYWTGASSQKGLDLEASSLLQWTAIQEMIGSGAEWYDTGEAFPGHKEGKLKGLSDFKKSFGGVLYPFYKGRYSVPGAKTRLVRLLRSVRDIIYER